MHIQSAADQSAGRQKPVYEQLLEAIADRRSVRIRYDSLAEEKGIVTRLSPYRLLFSRRSWYVVGRSSLHRATRTFNLGRILQMEPLDDHYQIPRGFSIDRYLRNAWHLIPEQGRDREVVVRFSKLVAQNVAEVDWHKTQRLVFRDDGTARLPRDRLGPERDLVVDSRLRRPGRSARAGRTPSARGPAGTTNGGAIRAGPNMTFREINFGSAEYRQECACGRRFCEYRWDSTSMTKTWRGNAISGTSAYSTRQGS